MAAVDFRAPIMKKAHVIAIVAAAVVAISAAGVVAYRGQQAQEAAQVAARNQTFLVRDHSPTLGQASAKVHIVEFLDPACETCSQFYPLMKQMLKTHPDQIRLSLRLIPFHPGADVAVKAIEAARAQDKYWQTLEALLNSQSKWVVNHRALPDRIWAQLGNVGLDLDRLRMDMESPEVAQRMAKDWNDSKAVRVTATPEFFVNGRPLPSFGYDELNTLVQNELSRAY